MHETITVKVKLMPNGLKFFFEPLWEETDFIDEIERKLFIIKSYTVMGRTARVERQPGMREFIDHEPNRMCARGIPVEVTDRTLQMIERANAEMRKEHQYDRQVAVVEIDGRRWMLHQYKNCVRSALNTRSRIEIAKQLGCEYVVTKRSASWIGTRTITVGV